MHSHVPDWWDEAVAAIRANYDRQFDGLPIHCSTSGGRTSAVMALFLREAFEDDPGRVYYSFRNTGREHRETLKFLDRLDRLYHIPIVWLEYVPPPKGAAPKHFSHRVVTYETADRGGKPLVSMLQALADFRATKGLDAIGMTPRMRLCTAKVKIAVGWQWMTGQVGPEFVDAVGLRADEPGRVSGLVAHRKGAEPWCPLAVAGIDKNMVLEFWAGREGDLALDEPWGNCDGCYLKDEADLADIFYTEPLVGEWWSIVEAHFGTPCPVRRPWASFSNHTEAEEWGRGRRLTLVGPAEHNGATVWLFHTAPTFNGTGATYSQIIEELSERMRIRAALAAGETPIGNRRLIRQESRLHRNKFSCSCEAAGALAESWEE